MPWWARPSWTTPAPKFTWREIRLSRNRTAAPTFRSQGFTGFFPSTRVNYLRLGASAYRPITNGFGLTLGANTYVAGRNIGKSTGYSAGITYNF